jgi:hypothetical protein
MTLNSRPPPCMKEGSSTMIEREFFRQLSPTRDPNRRVSTSRRSSGSPIVLIGILALVGWLTPGTTLAEVSWTSLALGDGDFINVLALDPSNPATFYSATDDEGVFKPTKGGANWTAINSSLTDFNVTPRAIDSALPSTLYAGANQGIPALRAAPSTTCEPGPDHLCLNASRFRVEATWTTPAGGTGSGQAVALTDDTGYYWFFDSTNVEIVIKVLDGCSLNGHFWVFAAGLTNVGVLLTVTDTTTGSIATYTNRQNKPFSPIQDTSAFVCGSSASAPKHRAALPATASIFTAKAAPVAPTVCDPSDVTTLCLNADRFSVTALWQTLGGSSGVGQAVSITSDTGYFWFFDPANVEVVVKVLNGCTLNQQFWVFAAGLTNVAVTITVTDVITGQARTYRNRQNTAFAPVQDTSALATCLPSCNSKGLTLDQVEHATNVSAQGLSDPFGADFNLVANRFMALEGCGLQSSSSSSSSLASKSMAQQCPDPTCASPQSIPPLEKSRPPQPALLPGTSATLLPFSFFADVEYCGPGNSGDGRHWYLGALAPSTTLNGACYQHDNCYTTHCVPDACYFDNSTKPTGCDDTLFAVCASVLPVALGHLCQSTSDCFICALAADLSRRPTSWTPTQCQVPPCTAPLQVCDASTGMCTDASIKPTRQSFTQIGGTGSVDVTVPIGSSWTAAVSKEYSWITITAGASGIGNGTVPGTVLYSVDANDTSSDRTGSMTIAGLTFEVTQAYVSISPPSQTFQAGGGPGSVTLSAPAGYSWTAVPSDTWITLTSASTGSGPGTVNYSVAANPDATQRTGAITWLDASGPAIATFTVTQVGILDYQQVNVEFTSEVLHFSGMRSCTTTQAGCQGITYAYTEYYIDTPLPGGLAFYKCGGQWDDGTRSASVQSQFENFQDRWTYTNGIAVGQGVHIGSCSVYPGPNRCPYTITLNWSVDFLGNADITASYYLQAAGVTDPNQPGCMFTCTETESHHRSAVWPVGVSDHGCPTSATTCQECNPYTLGH